MVAWEMQVRTAGSATVAVFSEDGASGAVSGELQRQSDVDRWRWKTTAVECGGCGVGWCGREKRKIRVRVLVVGRKESDEVSRFDW